jgi:hypothetical protein
VLVGRLRWSSWALAELCSRTPRCPACDNGNTVTFGAVSRCRDRPAGTAYDFGLTPPLKIGSADGWSAHLLSVAGSTTRRSGEAVPAGRGWTAA